MSLPIDEIRGLAALARLELTADEERLFAEQLGRLIDDFSQLSQLALLENSLSENITTSSLAPEDGEAVDRPDDPLPRAVFAANAPSTVDGYLTVPLIHDRTRPESEAE